ncbi:MAG: hypothetical protein QM784_35140 [Polyangiaceae bacterium]
MTLGFRTRALPLLLGLLSAFLVEVPATAAPNYYSQGATGKVDARVTIQSPKGGKFEPGGTMNIGWAKQTEGTEVDIWLYTASGDGIRGEKVRGIVASRSAAAGFTSKGGSFDWTIPEDIAKGRYVIVVTSGLDEATSPAFTITEPPIKLSAPRSESAGTLRLASVDGKGKGSVKLLSNDREVEFSWGSGQCPSLIGGLPGALVTLAALGGVTLVPIVRDVTKKDKVEQTCLDGFVILAPLPPVAPTSEPPPAPAP